jgi:cytochrome oxidase Cu insertion factor (SCO1/SenC/PrrC family)
MKIRNISFSLMLLLAVLLTACGGAPTADVMEKPTEAMMDYTPTPEAEMPHDTPTAEAAMPDDTAMPEDAMAMPGWFSASLTDVNTGQAFTINDFKGQVVLVETMAVWCPKCLTQQEQISALHALLGERDDFVSISLDIDPNEDQNVLSDYVRNAGFTWRYAVASPDVSRELASLYGDQFLNPPSTPILVVDRHGAAHPLPFGIKSAEDLMQALQPYLDESM